MDSQNKQILSYLEGHPEGITSMDAIRKFKITRLSGRIFDLRQKGYRIERKMEHKRGDMTHRYARYFLTVDDDE